jgi:hypothetical protein
MTTDALVLITEVCTAILAVAAVLGVAARILIAPRIREVDNSLARIEAHLERINGSVGRMDDWQHQHELNHARGERT